MSFGMHIKLIESNAYLFDVLIAAINPRQYCTDRSHVGGRQLT